MDNEWHKLNQFDSKTLPEREDYYLVVYVEPNGRGFGSCYRAVAYYDCLEGFNIKEGIVLYWKTVDWPDGFPIKQ